MAALATVQPHPRERIDRAVWRQLDPGERAYMLASGDVVLDCDGSPCVVHPKLQALLASVNEVLRLA